MPPDATGPPGRSIRVDGSKELNKSLEELTIAIRDALRSTDRELEASGFEPPRTLEDWEHLAHLAGMPFGTIQSGEFTHADVRAVALAWAERERMKARIAAEARGATTAATARSDARGADDESEPPALTATEVAVLRPLAIFNPSELASAARIEAAMESNVRLADRSSQPSAG